MAVYLETNAILGSSLSPKNYCICKITALNNGADPAKIQAVVPNAANNRLLPVSALQRQVTTYSIVFKDWDGTVISTQSVVQGGTVTKPADPTRSGYTFAGWSPTFSPTATQNVTYIATYTENASGKMYTITFAEERYCLDGLYYYMSDGSFVQYSKFDQIDTSNAVGIAYLAENAGDSFFIDTQDSNIIEFGQPDSLHIVNDGYELTQYLKRSLDSNNPMPSITWVSSRFDGNGYIPGEREMNIIADMYEPLNEMLSAIGGTPIYVGQADNDYTQIDEMDQNCKYWTSTYQSSQLLKYFAIGKVPYTHTITTGDGEEMEINSTRPYIQTGTDQPTSRHKIRALKKLNKAAPYSALDSEIYQVMQVAEGVTPNPNIPVSAGFVFTGWDPWLYPADKDEVYAATWQKESSGGGGSSSNPYQLYCNGVADGGTVYVDVHTKSVNISWSGSTKDNQWYVTGSGSGGSSQAGYHSWGSGYVNNLDFTDTVTIQQGGYISYNVYNIHPESGETTSTSGSWDVVVVESHN